MFKSFKRAGFALLLIVLVLLSHVGRIAFTAWWESRQKAPQVAHQDPAPPPKPNVEGNKTDRDTDRIAYLNHVQTALSDWYNREPAKLPISPRTARPFGASSEADLALLTGGSSFLGRKTDMRMSQSGLDFTLHVTSFNPKTSEVRGEINWPEFHSKHIFQGWLNNDSFLFREVKRVQRGECPLGLCYRLYFDREESVGEASVSSISLKMVTFPMTSPLLNRTSRPWIWIPARSIRAGRLSKMERIPQSSITRLG